MVDIESQYECRARRPSQQPKSPAYVGAETGRFKNYLYNSRGKENVESNLALSLSGARTWLEQENGGLRGAADKWRLQ